MIAKAQLRAGIIEVNGAQLYHEVRGEGPTVVFVPGATGDAGHFEYVADLLADEFTCVTYDRRGNSRSPRPAGWSQTSTEEQADDLAALLAATGSDQAVVYGTSGGAIIALCAILRHEQRFRAAILHEPPLMSVLAHPEDAMAIVQPVVEAGMASGGPRGAVESFLSFAAGEALGALPSATVDRMMGNGDVLFGAEFGTFESWRPDEHAMGRIAIPVHVLCGGMSAPFFAESCRWIAERLGRAVVPAPGTHVPTFDRPDELVAAIRPYLQKGVA